MPPTLSCGRSWSLPQTCLRPPPAGGHFRWTEAALSTDRNVCACPGTERRGPWTLPGYQSSIRGTGKWRNEDSHQGAEGGEPGSQLQERSSGQVWKLPEANTGM